MNVPKETMEQYMYNYLNQRYGLKNIIVEWAAGIINGIKRYSKEDTDVALFGKILRNECDEGFIVTHNETKSTIINNIKEVLRLKYRTKTETNLKSMIEEIKSKNIEKYLWKEIIKKMYTNDHYSILEQRIIKCCEEYIKSSNEKEERKLTREMISSSKRKKDLELPFKEFQKV